MLNSQSLSILRSYRRIMWTAVLALAVMTMASCTANVGTDSEIEVSDSEIGVVRQAMTLEEQACVRNCYNEAKEEFLQAVSECRDRYIADNSRNAYLIYRLCRRYYENEFSSQLRRCVKMVGQIVRGCADGLLFDTSICSCSSCPSGTVECKGRCVSDSCTGGRIFDTNECECKCPDNTVWDGSQCVISSCTSDFSLVPREVLSMGPNGTEGQGLLATYTNDEVVFGEGPIWFGPHEPGWVPSWYPADQLADESAPNLWETISGIGGETLTGYIQSPKTGTVVLDITCDDYCSINIPGIASAVADNIGTAQVFAQMETGIWYPITLVYENRWGTNGFVFSWRCPTVIE